jgi:hypothetical protein
MKKKLFRIVTVLSVIAVFAACKPEYEKEYSWAYPIAGDWTLSAYIDGEYIYGPFEMKAYNTSFGQDSIWFDDYPTATSANFWQIKYKVAANMSDRTFQTSGSINAVDGYPIEIIVSNGQVINNDSITFDIEFEDDPGTIYTLSGHRTTSYEEYMGEF